MSEMEEIKVRKEKSDDPATGGEITLNKAKNVGQLVEEMRNKRDSNDDNSDVDFNVK